MSSRIFLRVASLLATLLALFLATTWSQPARAVGLIVVVSDVSAQNNFSFYDAVLGNQTSVVFSRGAAQQPTLRTH